VDKLHIRQLRVPVLIGVLPEERLAPQMLCVDLECTVDITQAVATDHIAHALDYAQLTRTLSNYLKTTEFELLESLAEHTAKKLLAEFPMTWLRLSIGKKPADMPDVDSVGISIERESA